MSRKKKEKLSKSEKTWRILVIVLGAIFLYCIITFLVTPLFMIHPSFDRNAADTLSEDSSVEKISVSLSSTLSGYLYDDPDSEVLLIYFYGISDDAASSMEMLRGAYDNIDIAVVDWPSYGESEGIISDSSMKLSAKGIVTAFQSAGSPSEELPAGIIYPSLIGTDYSCEDVVIMGYSLGTGPAIYAAAECGCKDLILLSPYYSTVDLYNSVTPVFYGPMEGLLGFSIESHEYAENIALKPLVIASENDGRVPFESTVRLTESFASGCDFYTFPDMSHGDIPESPEVLEVIMQRLDQYH